MLVCAHKVTRCQPGAAKLPTYTTPPAALARPPLHRLRPRFLRTFCLGLNSAARAALPAFLRCFLPHSAAAFSSSVSSSLQGQRGGRVGWEVRDAHVQASTQHYEAHSAAGKGRAGALRALPREPYRQQAQRAGGAGRPAARSSSSIPAQPQHAAATARSAAHLASPPLRGARTKPLTGSSPSVFRRLRAGSTPRPAGWGGTRAQGRVI